MKTEPWAIFLVVICTFITASAQLFYKFGVNTFGSDIYSVIFNLNIWIGLCLYGVGAVMLVAALKYGELSILYPIIALGFVWVNLLSLRFLGESIGLIQWAGIVFIMFGVSFIGFGSRHKKKPELEVTPVVD